MVMDFVLTNGGKNSHSSTKKIPTAPVLLQWIWDKIQILGLILPPNSAQSSTPMKSSMHTLHAYFDQSWKNLHFLVRVGKFYIFWFEWKFCSCLGSELGKCQILSRVGKFYPPELEKSWLQRKKSNLANFSTPTLTSNFGKKWTIAT